MNSPFRNIPRSGDDVRNLRGWLEDLGRGSGGQSDTMRHSRASRTCAAVGVQFAEESTGSGLSRYRIEDVKNDYLLARPALPDGTSDTERHRSNRRAEDLRYSTWHTYRLRPALQRRPPAATPAT